MNERLISVIIPIFNSEKYLERCINSVVNQEYSNLQIILVNDGSIDSSVSICEKYKLLDSRIELLHKENGGLSSARNMGLSIAKGDYISFIDSDDWIEPDMYSYCMQLANKYNADIISTSYILWHSSKDSINNYDLRYRVMDKSTALEFFLESGMKNDISDYPVCTKIIKKSLFDNIFFPEGKLYEDYVPNVKLILKSDVYIKSNKVCYYYFQNNESIVHSSYKIKDNDLITESEEVCKIVNTMSVKIKNLALQKYARSYFSLLSKITLYGFDSNISENKQREIVCDLKKKIRKYKKILLKSDMSFSRKMLLLIYCVDYRLLIPFFRKKR